jgi:hypothetical protein
MAACVTVLIPFPLSIVVFQVSPMSSPIWIPPRLWPGLAYLLEESTHRSHESKKRKTKVLLYKNWFLPLGLKMELDYFWFWILRLFSIRFRDFRGTG